MKRIKGKRTKKDPNNASITKSRRGKPMKDLTSLKPARRFLNEQILQSQTALIAREEASKTNHISLENLPLELLYQIFFLSLELNLLQTSKLLQQALSTPAVHSALVLFAYFEDNEDYPVEIKLFRPADYRPLSVEDKLTLQVKIWKYDWCDPQLFEACLPKLWRLAYGQARHESLEHELSHIEEREDNNEDNSMTLSVARRLPTIDDETKLEPHFSAQKIWKPACGDRTTYSPSIVIPDVRTPDMRELIWKGKRKPVIGARHFPRRLLCHRPWTYDQIVCLQLLRQGSQAIQEVFIMDVSPKALFAGMANAIREQNKDALKTLLEIHGSYFAEVFPFDRFLTHLPIAASSDPIPLEIFHLATGQGEASYDLMMLLVRAGVKYIPSDDEVITSWAIHAQNSNNNNNKNLAAWLLEYMEHSNADDKSICFRLGAYRQRRGPQTHMRLQTLQPRSFQFPRTSFDQELNYQRFRKDVRLLS